MSKELEALEKINHTLCLNSHKIEFGVDEDSIDCKNVEDFVECYNTIRKYLKALKIIRDKKVDVEQIIENPDREKVIWYNTSFTGVLCEGWRMLSQEEYDLVREVLL